MRTPTLIAASARHVEALALVAAAHLLVERWGWDRARSFADRLHRGTGSAHEHAEDLHPLDLAIAHSVERSVQRASRLIPNAQCAPRALAARQMLNHRGISARLFVGLRLDPRPEAHAWLELGDPQRPTMLLARQGHTYQPVEALSSAQIRRL